MAPRIHQSLPLLLTLVLCSCIATSFAQEENSTTVQFSQTTYSVSESDNVISLQVEAVATGSPPATVQVTVSGFPGTMTSMNYSIPSDGSSVLNYTGIDDSVFSGNRTLTLTLNSTDTFVVVGTQSTATVMISEDDTITIGFEMESYSVTEGDNVSACVTLSSGSIASDTSVLVTAATEDGQDGAISGMDYTAVNMQLTFNSATNRQCVSVSTIFNADPMDDKQFTMSLSSDMPSSSVSLSPSTTNITIENIPTMVSPAESRVSFGETVIFTVVEIADSTYQWQRNGANISDDGRYSGATTAMLTVMNVTEVDEGNYSCVVTTSFGLEFTSQQAELLVFAPVTITTQPEPQNVNENDNAEFMVVASGDELTYLWRRDGVNLMDMVGQFMGVTTGMLTVISAQDVDEGAYSCLITNGAGDSVESNSANLTVVVAPTITVQPVSMSDVSLGDNVIFSVTASGDTPTYQWYMIDNDGNEMMISGAMAATYTISSVAEEDEGMYLCEVSNQADAVNSSVAALELLPLPVVTAPTASIVLVDMVASFSCVATNNATIDWTVVDDDNMMIAFSESVNGDNSTIMVTVDAIGLYNVTCNAINGRGTVTSSTTLNAITIQAENVTAGVSGTAVFFCNVTGLADRASIQYKWQSSQNGVVMGFPNEVFGNRTGGMLTETLTLSNVRELDGEYDYNCEISATSNNKIIGDTTATLTTNGPEIISPPVEELTLNAGELLELNCTAMNNVGASRNLIIVWIFTSFDQPLRNGIFNVNNSQVTEMMVGQDRLMSTFRINEAASINGGMYGCHAYNRELGDAVIANSSVTVFFTPQLNFVDLTVVNGMSVTLMCTVTAQPNATFGEIARIQGNGERIVMSRLNNTDGNTMFTVRYMFTAMFSEDDGAVFQCLAENDNGPQDANITVTVQARPSAIDHDNNVSHVLASLNSVNVTWPEPSSNNVMITQYNIAVCRIAPSENFSCVNEYNFTIMRSDLTSLPDGQLRYTAENIFPLSEYEIRIRAENSIGLQDDPVSGQGYRFSSASANNGSVVNFRVVPTTTVVILTWALPSLALNTSNLEVLFDVTYFRDGDQEDTVMANVSYNASLTEQGYSVDLSGTGSAQHTFTVVARYTIPFLVSTGVTLNNVATVNETLLPNERPRLPVDIDARQPMFRVTWPAPTNINFLASYRVSYTVESRQTGGRRKRQASQPMEQTVSADGTNNGSADLPLVPYSTYNVNINAIYRPPNGEPVEVRLLPTTPIDTPEGMSGAPTLNNPTNDGFRRIRLTWTAPNQPNGVISGYRVYVNGTTEAVSIDMSTEWVSPEYAANAQHSFRVVALNGFGEGDFSNERTITTLFGVDQPVILNPVVGTSGSPLFRITFGPFSNLFGELSTYQIIVDEGGDISSTRDLRSDTLLPVDETSTTYYVAFAGNVPSRQMTFTIGDGRTTQFGGVDYPNPPPSLDVNYRIFIRVYSLYNGATFNDSSLTQVLRINSPLNPAVIIGPIAAIAVVLLIILVVLLLVVFLFTRPKRGYTIASSGEDGHRKKRGGGIELRRTRLFSPVVNVPVPDVFTSAGQPTTLVCEASGTPAPEVVWTQNNEQLDKERFIQLADSSLFINDTDLKDEGAYIVTATNSAGTAEQMVRVTVIRPTPPEPDPERKPIKVGEFTEKIALLRADDDEGLEDEYSELEPDITFTSYAAKVNINKNKNRYINIIPYDHSRVVLSLQDNTPGSDYVNASYIDGFNRPNAYIATQGPQPSTFPDFWRMIWEFDCPTIVMVTNLKEEDKLKCHQYWPSYGTTTYGNVQVTLKGVENLAEYSIRTFHVTPIAGQSRVQMPVREVKQFHFLVWPDHGVPQFATPLLSFRKRVAKYHPDKKGPMVVHCSAGVGRTGTFITIDTMLRQMEAEGVIDIFNFVRHMRFRRNYMVQTAPQYVFIHDALLEAIMCGDNSIPAPELRKRLQALLEVDPESNKSRIQLQFENLNNNSPQDDDFDSSIASVPDNMAKNRYKVHLPANDYRVPLGALPPRSEAGDDDEDEEEKEKEEPDYICASFADGYRQRNAFIITQAPMSNTTGDFWKMIWEQKSAAIVMLTELEEDGKEMSVKYWPSEVGEAGLFGSFQLELSEDEKDKGDYVTRKFKLSHVDAPQECRIVTQFHFFKWPRSSTPANPHSVIDLIDEIQRVQRKSGNQPITIHCDDGVSRTGAFCTLYSVLERVKVDQVVDVYLATKTLRIQRAGLLETLDQYVFVHKAVVEFLDSFSDYQNFK